MIKIFCILFVVWSSQSSFGQSMPAPPEPPETHNRTDYDPKKDGTSSDEVQQPVEGSIKIAADTKETRGTFSNSKDRVDFSSRQIQETSKVRVNVRVRELMLQADIDFSSKTAKLAAESKQGTPRITNDIRNLLLGTLRSVEQQRRTKEDQLTLSWEALERTLGLWSEWPDDLSLFYSVSETTTKKIESLCDQAKCLTVSGPSYFGACTDKDGQDTTKYYEFAAHDCDQGDFSYEFNQQRASLGAHSSCSGSEWYWDGSAWLCGKPNHWKRPFVQGNCFGRCGPDCGMLGIYSKDCTNHDGCVRNGHSIISPYCNDQFAACIDDELLAPRCYDRS